MSLCLKWKSIQVKSDENSRDTIRRQDTIILMFFFFHSMFVNNIVKNEGKCM